MCEILSEIGLVVALIFLSRLVLLMTARPSIIGVLFKESDWGIIPVPTGGVEARWGIVVVATIQVVRSL